MSWIALAGAAASLIGGSKASKAAEKSGEASLEAANIQASASRDIAAMQQQTAREGIGAQAYMSMPWTNIGAGALYQLAYGLGLDPRTLFPGGFDGGSLAFPQPREGTQAQPQQQQQQIPMSGFMQPGTIFGRGMPTGIVGAIAGALAPQQQPAPVQEQLPIGIQDYLPPLPAPQDPNRPIGWLTRKFTMDDFEADPGYQFRLDQGQRGIERMRGGSGMMLSGPRAKDVMAFGQGLASDEYGKSYGRYWGEQDRMYNQLANLAGVGQVSAGQTGEGARLTLGNLGGQLGQTMAGGANAMAAGQIGAANAGMAGANAWNQALGNAGNIAMQQYTMNQLFGGGGGGFNYAPAMAQGAPASMFQGLPP